LGLNLLARRSDLGRPVRRRRPSDALRQRGLRWMQPAGLSFAGIRRNGWCPILNGTWAVPSGPCPLTTGGAMVGRHLPNELCW